VDITKSCDTYYWYARKIFLETKSTTRKKPLSPANCIDKLATVQYTTTLITSHCGVVAKGKTVIALSRQRVRYRTLKGSMPWYIFGTFLGFYMEPFRSDNDV